MKKNQFWILFVPLIFLLEVSSDLSDFDFIFLCSCWSLSVHLDPSTSSFSGF
jgi:hypothetical protein